jgi:hypothetical protein
MNNSNILNKYKKLLCILFIFLIISLFFYHYVYENYRNLKDTYDYSNIISNEDENTDSCGCGR